MARLLQVGAGSGGMSVLDIVARDPRITHVTLIEPDVYKPHNVVRHLFPAADVGQKKADLAARWLQERRSDLPVAVLACDLLDPAYAGPVEEAVARCDLGICAADNEPAKFHFDMLMRRHRKPWTLGEVLSGGIGGFVHCLNPGGPCYGCIASFLRRSAAEPDKKVDYAQRGGPVHETTIPASRASIAVIASLHAHLTLGMLAGSPSLEGKSHPRESEYLIPGLARDFTSLLYTLEKVPGMFEEAYRTHRFRIARSPDCLICREDAVPRDLDQAVDDALARLNES